MLNVTCFTLYDITMSFETQRDNELRNRRSREAQEMRGEVRENEPDAELKKAAAMERADVIIKEVKGNKKQMQNIVLHMQTVLQTIKQLRQQLQLAQVDDDVTSVKADKKRVEELKRKIADYGFELEKMRGDMIREQIEELKGGIGVGMTVGQLQTKAEEMVEEMIEFAKE